jgi:hypothetical protein
MHLRSSVFQLENVEDIKALLHPASLAKERFREPLRLKDGGCTGIGGGLEAALPIPLVGSAE